MKTQNPFDQETFSFRILPCCLAAVMFIPSQAAADLSGGDSLATQSGKWAPFTGFGKSGAGKYQFQNSRLEFLVKSPTNEDLSILRWTPNKGGYDQDWFIQVDVHLAKVALNSGCYTNLNLGVINTEDPGQGYVLAIDRYTDGPGYVSGFETSMANELNDDYQKSPALDATLRIHFDSNSKTMTSSWKSGTVWKYFPSTRITDWEMDKSSTFTVILAAAGGGHDDGTGFGPVIKSGEAFFSNFKTGTAKPDIAVEQPAGSDLTDGKAKKSFGTVALSGGTSTRIFTIRNTGSAKLKNLTITKTGTHASDFTTTAPAKATLLPGGSTTFKVTFDPKAAGTRNATIRIGSNDPDENPFDISITGMCAP